MLLKTPVNHMLLCLSVIILAMPGMPGGSLFSGLLQQISSLLLPFTAKMYFLLCIPQFGFLCSFSFICPCKFVLGADLCGIIQLTLLVEMLLLCFLIGVGLNSVA